MRRVFSIALWLLVLSASGAFAQTDQNNTAQRATVMLQYPLIPIQNTAAVNNQVTLTIPAPPPTWYNYVCTLMFDASQQVATPAAITLGVTTSTNFNAYALKFSLAATASQDYRWQEIWDVGGVGCAKSAAPGVATTFVSPVAASTVAFAWTATYYQAP